MARRQDGAQQAGSPPPSRTEGSDPLLTVEHLTVGYGNVAAVRGLDLEVRRGEIVALFGANGAGKSTTLMAIAGVLKPMSGTINWKGQRARGPLHRRAKQGIAYMPEQRSVISGLSTRDNLRLGLGPAATALELFPELRPLLGRRGGLLSGGEQQILGLARALACQPSLLLIDELSLGLAPRVVSRALSALRRVATEQRHRRPAGRAARAAGARGLRPRLRVAPRRTGAQRHLQRSAWPVVRDRRSLPGARRSRPPRKRVTNPAEQAS